MSNDLIEKRNERTKQRKAKKKRIDSLIGLSVNDEGKETISLSASVATVSDTEQTARLLDEGFCDNGFILKKGALEKYLNGENQHVTGWEMVDGSWQKTEVLNLTDDFIGTVNLGHKDFATDPFILGEFKKSDFTLVDIENDRKALDVNVRLDEESTFVKELRRQPYDIGVSAEFYYHVDREATDQLYEEYGMWVPVLDEIFIFAYGLVGECGNVNSSGLELKGETNMAENVKDLKADEEVMDEYIEDSEPAEDDVIKESVDTDAEESETEELTAEEEAEDTVTLLEGEQAEEASEGEEATVEEAELGISDEDEGDEAELSEVLTVVNTLKEQVAQLTSKVETLEETNCELKKTNKRLSAKLKDEKKKKEEFIQNAKSVSVKLGVNESKPKQNNVIDSKFAYGDGIGD